MALFFYNDMQKNKLVNNNWILGNISNPAAADGLHDGRVIHWPVTFTVMPWSDSPL